MIPEDYSDFLKTLQNKEPLANWPEALKSLWYDATNNWEASHNIAQDMHSTLGSWIHAYLHRKEGDEWNAGYWYRQAGREFPKTTLKEEQQHLVEYILKF